MVLFNSQQHWDKLYDTKAENEVSGFNLIPKHQWSS
jgi:hypothetical protein